MTPTIPPAGRDRSTIVRAFLSRVELRETILHAGGEPEDRATRLRAEDQELASLDDDEPAA